jgi:hypothetical protein
VLQSLFFKQEHLHVLMAWCKQAPVGSTSLSNVSGEFGFVDVWSSSTLRSTNRFEDGPCASNQFEPWPHP